MANNHNDGGAAFPRPASEFTKNGTCSDGNDPIDAQRGMTLRDYFAGQAVVALIQLEGCNDMTATVAYRIADSMIKARGE